MSPALSERKNTTCSGVIPVVMMTLVVEAFMPKSMVATRAKMTPSVGFFWVN
jgi:hypothetical protein